MMPWQLRRLTDLRSAPYGVALLLSAAATLVSLGMDQYLPRTNDLSLVYIVAVVLAAINGGIRPALACAGLGFLALNFFFTEPRGTLMMVRQDDVITVAWFLVVAVVVGRLAATFQEKLALLQGKDRFARIELELMQRLTLAIHDEEVIEALLTAMSRQTGMECHVARVWEDQVDWESSGADVDIRLRRRIDALLDRSSSARTIPVLKRPPWIALPLLAGDELVAFVLLHCGDRIVSPGVFDYTELLVQQAGLALGRTRLVADLSRERFEKEREMLRSSLLSSVSHDFRTPLTAMTGAASTLLEMSDALPPEERAELLESIMNEARRLDDYTQNLLDMTRLGSGTLALERDWVSVEDLVDHVLVRIRPHLDEHAIDFAVEGTLPLLHVHAALLEQAIFNVLHNAVKFSPRGSTIRIRVQRKHDDLLFRVIDEGPGIPENERSAVFDMFHSSSRGDRRAAGSGLGLAICKGMIGAHGGSVRVSDAPEGHGCMVEMTLPMDVALRGGIREGKQDGDHSHHR
ncbi:MAG: sensor histidine kinase [Pseudomonadota bacterium]